MNEIPESHMPQRELSMHGEFAARLQRATRSQRGSRRRAGAFRKDGKFRARWRAPENDNLRNDTVAAQIPRYGQGFQQTCARNQVAPRLGRPSLGCWPTEGVTQSQHDRTPRAAARRRADGGSRRLFVACLAVQRDPSGALDGLPIRGVRLRRRLPASDAAAPSRREDFVMPV